MKRRRGSKVVGPRVRCIKLAARTIDGIKGLRAVEAISIGRMKKIDGNGTDRVEIMVSGHQLKLLVKHPGRAQELRVRISDIEAAKQGIAQSLRRRKIKVLF